MAKRRGGRFKKMLGLGFISFEKAFSFYLRTTYKRTGAALFTLVYQHKQDRIDTARTASKAVSDYKSFNV
jgi:hypothetical protein